ncbi:hypothetical protein NDU88_001479 [Pleurodeles waltl]|uniref:Uncharacterized protein n=1 Tax=Pleurodeles waltl TaxID=8319 RepID=A0AAV7SB12_PLEWA|nr:hypothetical protein NDU88_001479 [Pleurodeles waltl]
MASSWSTGRYQFPNCSGGSKRNGEERRSPPHQHRRFKTGKMTPTQGLHQTRGATRPGSTPWPVPGPNRLAQNTAMLLRHTDATQSVCLVSLVSPYPAVSHPAPASAP